MHDLVGQVAERYGIVGDFVMLSIPHVEYIDMFVLSPLNRQHNIMEFEQPPTQARDDTLDLLEG